MTNYIWKPTMTDQQQEQPEQQTRFEVCQQVISQWKQDNAIVQNLDDQTRMLVARVNSWVSAVSVVAGVRDVMSCAIPHSPTIGAAIEDLGNILGKRLLAAGFLIASPRRSGGFSS